MAEIDPVILQLRAEVEKYQADVKRATRTVDQHLGMQSKRVKKLEDDFRRSSGNISSTLRGLAGTLGTLFTGRELVGLLDSFTRLQNNLKVAGLEGAALAQVQGELLGLSQRYGVELESLSSVFLKASLVQKELGASTEQIIRLNEITAASLKITGTSAAEAQGALLQLGQALGSGVVRAEEFNSILEGALPLAQAAARGIDGFGGSVSKLRAAIADGQITSQQFFEGVLKGGVQTLADAEKATLTLSGGFTALTSSITVYFGEADKANGVSVALGAALKALADNLETIIPALAVIATALGGRFVAGALAGGTALRALSAYATIATTSLAGTALAARGAGAALLAAFGGPVGLAITAITLGITYLVVATQKADEATGQYKETLDQSQKASDAAREAAERLASAHGRTRAEALAAAKAERENTKQKLAGAKASLILAQAELKKARAFQAAQNQASFGSTGLPGTGTFIQGTGDTKVALARANVSGAERAISNFEAGIATLNSAINSAAAPAVASVASKPTKATGGGGSGGAGGSGASGPSASQIAERFNNELASVSQQALTAMQSLATTAEDRAEYELRSIEIARIRTQASIAADEDYSKTQKERLAFEVENLAALEREIIERNLRVEQEREAQDIADERYQNEQDALRLQLDLADTEAQRRDIAFAILEAEDRYLTAKLEAVIANEDLADIERERARLALAGLQGTAGARREQVSRANEGALARYARSVQDTDARVEELAVQKIRDINESITNAITNELGIKDDFISGLISIFLEKAIFGPLAESLSGSGGGGGGIGSAIGSIIGSIFGGGRASGGPVTGGKFYRVNEGASPGRVEGFQPTGSGKIIPLGQMNAMQQSGGNAGGGVVTVRLALSGDIDAKIDQRSAAVAVEVTRAAAPQIVDAAANETFRRSGRPTL